MAKPTFKRTTTIVVAIECAVVGTATPQEVGQAVVGRLELPEHFYHYVNKTTITPRSYGLLDTHEGVPLEEAEQT